MPSTYAHYRFGLDVERCLPEEMQALTQQYRQLFQIGFHGPDLLFHYFVMKNNPVNHVGFAVHEETGRTFFGRCKEILEETPEFQPCAAGSDRAAAVAYLLGVTCHFALDSFSHPYVGEAIQKYGLTHNGIESAYERALMVHDGLDPVTHHVADHIIATAKNAEVIAPFFPPATTRQILTALRFFVLDCNMLVPSNLPKVALVDFTFRLSGQYREARGMMMNRHHEDIYVPTDRQLFRLYYEALEAAPEMLCEMYDFLCGAGELDERFDRNFNGD